MNPFRFLKKTLKTIAISTPLALYAGGLTGFWLPISIANNDAQEKVYNFTQTEIFQTLKAEEETQLDAMKRELDIAKEQQEKGEIPPQTYYALKYDYDKKTEYVNSENFKLDAMINLDPDAYNDYNISYNVANTCYSGAMPYTIFGGIGTLAISGIIIHDDWKNFNYHFDNKIEAWDEKKRNTENKKQAIELGK